MLELVFLPMSRPDPAYSKYYQLAADCWRKVWLSLYAEHDVQHELPLDALLRQDEAACLFTPDGCAALILFRTIDFSVLNYRHDSYFKDWTDADLEVLLKAGSKAFLTTFLTVDPLFRSYRPDVKLKQVLLNIMIRRFLEGRADVISGITRRDRGIHDESYKLGASLVRENVEYLEGRFRVDLVAFYRDQARESDNEKVRALTDQVWENRLDLTMAIGPTPRLKIA